MFRIHSQNSYINEFYGSVRSPRIAASFSIGQCMAQPILYVYGYDKVYEHSYMTEYSTTCRTGSEISLHNPTTRIW